MRLHNLSILQMIIYSVTAVVTVAVWEDVFLYAHSRKYDIG